MIAPVGVALIGLGMWGKRLAAAVKRAPLLRLVTCYSRDEAKRQVFARDFDCQAAASLAVAIENPSVEAVLIVTPNFHHKEAVGACVERGKPVFVEKPIADSMQDGRAIQEACRSAGLTLVVGHCFRRLGAARKVKQLLDEGRLGSVVLAEANFSLPGKLTPDKWRYYRETCPGGPLLQLGIHHADTLQYWLGPVERVQGSFAHLVTPAEIDDVGSALLEFAGGALGTLNSSYVSPKTYHLRLYGDQGILDYQADMSVWPNAEKMDSATTLRLQTSDGEREVSFEPKDMLVEELEEFASCVRGEAQPEVGAGEALAALAVILGALKSNQTGVSVNLSEL